MSKKNIIIISIVAVVLIAGAGGFYFYTQAQNKKTVNTSTNTAATRNGGGRFGANGGAANFKNVTGTIVSLQDKQLTVEDSDGNQNLILLSDTTRISKNSADTSDDILKADNNISVMSQSNTTDPVVATTITLQNQTNPDSQNQQSNTGGQNRGGGRNGTQNMTQGFGQNMVRGQITSIGSGTFKVKNFNGTEVNVSYDSQTKFNKVEQGAIADLKVDQKVIVSSSTTNGVNTARIVSIEN